MVKKKGQIVDLAQKRSLIDWQHPNISLNRQCELLMLSKSGLYYEPASESIENLHYMRLIDEEFTRYPFYGVIRMHQFLLRAGYSVNIKRVRRLCRLMGLEAIYPKPNLSKPMNETVKYPYLLRGKKITQCNQVWSTDITYIPMAKGFMYLTAVIDWYSRYVLAWDVSNSMDTEFCVNVLDRSLEKQKPEIFNTDQGSQYTSELFTQRLIDNNLKISRDGKGRALDNIFVERLWRSVKYEEVYLNAYQDGKSLRTNLAAYFEFYNHKRPHQSLNHKTPAEVYTKG